MRAKIYRPAKTAMSSGQAKNKHWVLENAPSSAREIDPLMGWTSSGDTQSQVTLRFENKEEAINYANDNGIEADIFEHRKRATNIRLGGYGENFSVNRKDAWTH